MTDVGAHQAMYFLSYIDVAAAAIDLHEVPSVSRNGQARRQRVFP